MKKYFLHLFTLLIVFVSFYTAQGQAIDKEASKVRFEISNMAFNTVEGSFSHMAGTVQFHPDSCQNAKFDVCVEAATVHTDNDSRDEHLRKEDFFEVATYPNICFVSSKVQKKGSGYSVEGKLTMHGVTKTVKIPFDYKNKTLKGTITLQRLDYGVGGEGGFMVGKEVDITIFCVLKDI